MIDHHCHAIGCETMVPPKMFACRKHWSMVPRWLQHLLWSVYIPGQEQSKDPSRIYLLVQSRCRVAIAKKEGLSIEEPMRLIRSLAATSRAGSLHREIQNKTDDEAIAILDEGIAHLVEASIHRRRVSDDLFSKKG